MQNRRVPKGSHYSDNPHLTLIVRMTDDAFQTNLKLVLARLPLYACIKVQFMQSMQLSMGVYLNYL